jgi:hypothetical protein
MGMMKKIAWALYFVVSVALADDVPCKETGIAHCEGRKFVCNNGNIEKYKKLDCTERYKSTKSGVDGDLDGDGVLSGSEQYLLNTEAKKEIEYVEEEGIIGSYYGQGSVPINISGQQGSSAIHIGKRGGRFRITSGGNKRYLPRN